ncbi:predicted protein [Plenodomus lingam JN3]|uniref:Predicted protein n=1 Tax=Leptosphaeria maculans (strain JN3 / isolate v23.1.3 / race Av1-4-5-6-7-8) TaxID=985895 RepID=E5A0N0_LEPMJ|nr:predicted protein [Plenodomus lingam JN3]CBX97090.1 predicted protein [Plenodomus lingam JN3]
MARENTRVRVAQAALIHIPTHMNMYMCLASAPAWNGEAVVKLDKLDAAARQRPAKHEAPPRP